MKNAIKKFVKKVVIIGAAVAMLVTGTVAAQAGTSSSTGKVRKFQSVQTYYVSAKRGVYVRTNPTTQSKAIGGILMGEKVYVTGRVYHRAAPTSWVQVNYNGRKAFVTLTALTKNRPSVIGTTKTVKVQNGYLALRSSQSDGKSNIFAKLYTGDKVTVKKANGTYWLVYSQRLGKTGYVNHNFLV